MKRIRIESVPESKDKPLSTNDAFFGNHSLTNELLAFFPILERFDFQTLTRECSRCVEPITTKYWSLTDRDKKRNAVDRRVLAQFVISLDDLGILIRHLATETDRHLDPKTEYVQTKWVLKSARAGEFFFSDLVTSQLDGWNVLQNCSTTVVTWLLENFVDLIQAQYHHGTVNQVPGLWKGVVAFMTRYARTNVGYDEFGRLFLSLFQRLSTGRFNINPSTDEDQYIFATRREALKAVWLTLVDPTALKPHEAQELVSIVPTLYDCESFSVRIHYDINWVPEPGQGLNNTKVVRRIVLLYEQIKLNLTGGRGSIPPSDEFRSRSVEFLSHIEKILQDLVETDWCSSKPKLLAMIRTRLPLSRDEIRDRVLDELRGIFGDDEAT